jgi:hypothetical protein
MASRGPIRRNSPGVGQCSCPTNRACRYRPLSPGRLTHWPMQPATTSAIFMMPYYSVWSLIYVAIAIMVIYGLAARYGEQAA